MSKEDNDIERVVLPKKLFNPGNEPKQVLERINRHSSQKKLVKFVKDLLRDDEFTKLENSFLGPVIKFASLKKIIFSRHLIHHLLLRRIMTSSNEMWFTFQEQPMRFSLREYALTTGLPCEAEAESPPHKEPEKKKQKREEDKWLKTGTTLKTLCDTLEKKGNEMLPEERTRLGALVLVEGILMAQNAVTQIPKENLERASTFEEFCKYPWGRISYNVLMEAVKSLSPDKLSKEQYGLSGFAIAIQMWAFSSIDELGKQYGTKMAVLEDLQEDNLPLMLHWEGNKNVNEEQINKLANGIKVSVNPVIGDPKQYDNLVTQPEDEIMNRVLEELKKGHRLAKEEWIQGWFIVKKDQTAKHNRPVRVDRTKKTKDNVNQENKMSNSAKIDNILKICQVLGKRMKRIEKHIASTSGESGKQDAAEANKKKNDDTEVKNYKV